MSLVAVCFAVLWAFAQAQPNPNLFLAPGIQVTPETAPVDPKEVNDDVPEYGSPKPAIFATAVNDFGLRLLAEARKGDKEGNLIFSPLSLCAAFSLIHFGAQGETKKDMDNVLGFQNGLVPNLIKEKADEYRDNAEEDVALANRAYFQEGLPINEIYQDGVGKSNVGKLDFAGDPEAARKKINSFISKTTKGSIKEGLAPGSVDSSTLLVLVNAIFFKAAWETPFDKEKTVAGKFKGVNGKQEVQYMGDDSGKTDILWRNVPELNAQAIELPYKGSKFSMFIVLPDTEDGWIDAENNLARVLTKGLLFDGATAKPVNKLQIPKFDLEGQLENLKENLEAMGLDSLFTDADFSGITNDPLFLSEIVHKAKVKIDEEGTTAAAVSAALFQKSAISDEFVVDRPFLFFIVDKTEGTIWFQGTVTHF